MKSLFVETIILFSVMLMHVILCPFTKVEESFNIQAAHDLLFKSPQDVSNFDHIEFPGVVPRTFIGPLILAAISYSPKAVFNLSPFATLHVVRAVLGTFTILSLIAVRCALASRFSAVAGRIFTLLTVTQFHVMFYASRTLPNTFALILTNIAYADRLRAHPYRRSYRAVVIMSVACALFRSELCLYIFAILVTDLACRHIEFVRTIGLGLVTAITTSASSTLIDSYFWNRWCYPELEVFIFNVVLNKSSAWGTSPFHWYFTNALPRALGGSYVLAVVATCANFAVLAPLVLPVVAFVAIYSALPHKELRFVFYALPVFTSAAAVCIERAYGFVRSELWQSNDKKVEDEKDGSVTTLRTRMFGRRAANNIVLLLLAVATVFASTLQTIISTAASRANYPGAYAIRAMHEIESKVYTEAGLCNPNESVIALVHIDADSAMTGVSQFLEQKLKPEQCPQWRYSKREDVETIVWKDYTHLISERKHVEGFCVVHVQDAYAGLGKRGVQIRMSPHTFVHRNVNISALRCL